jgi:beta propeller repeat protein
MYDINTRKSEPVDFTESAQLCPDVSGDHIVWLDFGPYPSNLPWGGNVYLHDIKTGITEKISKDRKQDYPKISGDYVVWLDSWGAGHDIYLYSFLDLGRDFLSGDEGSIYDVTPTPLPTPETKVRFYSTILKGDTDWYSLTPSGNTQLSFELRWSDNDTELSLSVVSPSGYIWHFIDTDDDNDDNAIRMTISNINSYFRDNGKWTVAVSGGKMSSETDYDICWY